MDFLNGQQVEVESQGYTTGGFDVKVPLPLKCYFNVTVF